jgi:hypothetical protein
MPSRHDSPCRCDTRRKKAPPGARQIPRIRDSQPRSLPQLRGRAGHLHPRGTELARTGEPGKSTGTKQSIEYVLRSLDRQAEDEKKEIKRQEKALARPAL